MAAILSGFFTALAGTVLALVPLWVLARRPGDLAASVANFGAALLLACFALTAAAFVVPPLYARAALLALISVLAAVRIRVAVRTPLDEWFGLLLVLAALASALLPDTVYVFWDNYTHWSVLLKSFDFGEPYIGNGYTKFASYPPYHAMLVYFLQGIVPFTTANLQTYKVVLLAYLTVLMVFGTPRPKRPTTIELLAWIALFPLLLGLSFVLTGYLQSALADFTAAVLIAIAVVAAFHHALQPRRAMRSLSALALCAVAVTRMGMWPVAVIFAAALVALDIWLRRGAGEYRVREQAMLYGAIIAGPLLCYQFYAAVMAAQYGALQSTPGSLLDSFAALFGGRDRAVFASAAKAVLFEGKPTFRGYGVSPAVLTLAGAAIGLLAAWLNRAHRGLMLGFVAVMTGVAVLWIVAIVLQMHSFFNGDPTLPSLARYVGILLLPLLAVVFFLHLQPADRRSRTISSALVIAAALILHAALIPSQFWLRSRDESDAVPLARAVRPFLGRDRVWVLTSREAGDAHYRYFAFRYLLMPAHTNGNECFVAPPCGIESADTFASRLFLEGYRWVLVDSIGAPERALLEPLLTGMKLAATDARKPRLFRVVANAAEPGRVRLISVEAPGRYLAPGDVPRDGAVS